MEDICTAKKIGTVNLEANCFLRENQYTFPALSALRKLIAQIVLNRGILSNILSRTKNKVSLLQIRQIFCLTCFHEVYISQKVKIDRRNEQGVGANKTMNLCIGICLLHN